MFSTKLCYFKLMICLMVLCTFIEISQTRSTLSDDVEYQNNYGKYPFQDDFYNIKSFNHDDTHLAKRIIMLPRVGRRSINKK